MLSILTKKGICFPSKCFCRLVSQLSEIVRLARSNVNHLTCPLFLLYDNEYCWLDYMLSFWSSSSLYFMKCSLHKICPCLWISCQSETPRRSVKQWLEVLLKTELNFSYILWCLSGMNLQHCMFVVLLVNCGKHWSDTEVAHILDVSHLLVFS